MQNCNQWEKGNKVSPTIAPACRLNAVCRPKHRDGAGDWQWLWNERTSEFREARWLDWHFQGRGPEMGELHRKRTLQTGKGGPLGFGLNYIDLSTHEKIFYLKVWTNTQEISKQIIPSDLIGMETAFVPTSQAGEGLFPLFLFLLVRKMKMISCSFDFVLIWWDWPSLHIKSNL